MTLDSLLLLGSTAAAILWAALSAFVLYVSGRRERARSAVSRALAMLQNDTAHPGDVEARVIRVKPFLDRLSRDMIVHTTADRSTPHDTFEVLTTYLDDRWPMDGLVRDAAAHARPRDLWRRIAALKILFQLNHPRAYAMLDAAVGGADSNVAEAALSLLASSDDPAAVDILIRALKAGRQRPAVVAAHLECSPQRPIEALRQLLSEPDPVVRSWAARLLGAYPGVEGLESELAVQAADPDPRVRKAAVGSLGQVGDDTAASVALRLLADPVPYVRAQAARALGDLGRVDDAAGVAVLLADADFWVRAAAKQSLEAMGADVWTVLVPCLDHEDRFVRNGAAEVFQNLGIVDDLVLMEAASDNPSRSKIELLRRIAFAGGTRLTDSLVERAGALTGPKVRRLLVTIGFEHVGAA